MDWFPISITSWKILKSTGYEAQHITLEVPHNQEQHADDEQPALRAKTSPIEMGRSRTKRKREEFQSDDECQHKRHAIVQDDDRDDGEIDGKKSVARPPLRLVIPAPRHRVPRPRTRR